MLSTLFGLYPFLKKIFADGGYQGPIFEQGVAMLLRHFDVEIVKLSSGPTPPRGSSCCRAGGLSSALSPGSDAAVASPRTSTQKPVTLSPSSPVDAPTSITRRTCNAFAGRRAPQHPLCLALDATVGEALAPDECLETMVAFTAHNIRLEDGSQTFPELGWTLDQAPHVAVVKRLASILFPDGMNGKRIVDLGCLEGGYATEFARLGLDSVGIEVRKSNFENCIYIKNHIDLNNLKFYRDDAWNVGAYGPFDIVFCVGLFYHIDKVTAFMKEIARNCGRMIFLDTHFAAQEDCSPAVKTYNLSALTTHEGMPGRWFPEHALETDSQALDELKWASWDNKSSFWPTRPAILRLLRQAGFTTVFESFEQFGDDLVAAMGPNGYYNTNTRSVFVGFK